MTTLPPPELEVRATGKLSDYSGSKSPAFTNSLLNAVINTAWLPNGADQEAKTRQAHITLEVLRGFNSPLIKSRSTSQATLCWA
jgi:hypothetical protein